MSTMAERKRYLEVMMERVTFNDLEETIKFYIARSNDPRLSGWEHNHYRKWLKNIQVLIKDAAELPLHEE